MTEPTKSDAAPTWGPAMAGFVYSNPRSRAVQACKLLQDPRIIAACNEYGRARLRTGLSPVAFQAVKEMLGNRNSKQRMRAADAVLNRTDPIEHAPMIINNVVAMQSGEQMLAQLKVLCEKHNVNMAALLGARPEERAKLIDAQPAGATDTEPRP
jgi:hypothetical protein